MWSFIEDFNIFYRSHLGKVVCKTIRKHISKRWENPHGQTILGLGYASPFMKPFRQNNTTLALMYRHQGVTTWPRDDKNLTAQVDEHSLPIFNGDIDKILLIHGLEHTLHINSQLSEIWRVLKGNGHVIIVVPARMSIWARYEKTPLASGRPYTISQLKDVVRMHGLEPIWEEKIIKYPPFWHKALFPFYPIISRVVDTLLPNFGGMILLECKKDVYAPIPKGGSKSPVTDSFRPILKPVSATPKIINKKDSTND